MANILVDEAGSSPGVIGFPRLRHTYVQRVSAVQAPRCEHFRGISLPCALRRRRELRVYRGQLSRCRGGGHWHWHSNSGALLPDVTGERQVSRWWVRRDQRGSRRSQSGEKGPRPGQEGSWLGNECKTRAGAGAGFRACSCARTARAGRTPQSCERIGIISEDVWWAASHG